MRKVNLCDFIHQIVDDEYALNVVYYSIKRMIVQREFDMGGITRFSIDERFLGEKTEVICRIRITGNAIWFSFLLSLRILMLDKDKIKFCSDDYLIFKPFPDQQFQWIKLLSFIVSHSQDNEVRMLYQLLGSAYDQQMPTDDMMDKFAKSMEMPEYKHLRKYYKNLSARTKGVNVPVVGDNAFLEADFEEYTLDKEIEYVGNTAFAFCKKLKTLRLQEKVLFGTFPIVECPKLEQIIVPEVFVDYYKEALPFYKAIIIGEEHARQAKERMPENDRYTKSETEDITSIDISNPGDSGISGNNLADVHKKKTLDVKLLEHVFDKKATSYKFFWFISILTLAKERESLAISFKDLLIRMASIAWQMVLEDNLELGKSDCMKKYLQEVERKTSLISSATPNVVEKYLIQHYDSQGVSKALTPLLKNVPYRFLSPWIKFTSNEDVIRKSNSKDYTGLYAIVSESVILDEDWWEHINANYDKLYNFAIQSLIDYASLHNPPMKLLKLKMRMTISKN